MFIPIFFKNNKKKSQVSLHQASCFSRYPIESWQKHLEINSTIVLISQARKPRLGRCREWPEVTQQVSGRAQSPTARPAVSPAGALATKGTTPSLPTFHSSAQTPLPGDSKQDPDGRFPADRDGAELETPLPGFPNASQTSVLEASGALLLGWWGAERQPSLATQTLLVTAGGQGAGTGPQVFPQTL